MKDLFELVEQYPNDMELGAKIRELYWENISRLEKLQKEMEGKKIYESPDGGKTIYERNFGEDVRDRRLVTNQLTIFDDEAYTES